MGAPNASRVYTQEGRNTFISTRLDLILDEIDARTNGRDSWVEITRTSGLISKVTVYSDAAKTVKVSEYDFTRSAGVGGVSLVTEIDATFYNEDQTTDSTIVETITRPDLGTDDVITECASPFTTTESTKR